MVTGKQCSVRLGGRCTRFSSHTHRDRVLQVTSAPFKARRVNPKNFFAELKRRNVYKVAVDLVKFVGLAK